MTTAITAHNSPCNIPNTVEVDYDLWCIDPDAAIARALPGLVDCTARCRAVLSRFSTGYGDLLGLVERDGDCYEVVASPQHGPGIATLTHVGSFSDYVAEWAPRFAQTRGEIDDAARWAEVHTDTIDIDHLGDAGSAEDLEALADDLVGRIVVHDDVLIVSTAHVGERVTVRYIGDVDSYRKWIADLVESGDYLPTEVA